MDLKYVIVDKSFGVPPPPAVQVLDVDQGEIKQLEVLLSQSDGTPLTFSMGSGDIIVKIGPPPAAVTKKLSLSQVTAVNGPTGVTGCQFTLSATDTAALLPGSNDMSVEFQDAVSSPVNAAIIDMPGALNIKAPLSS